MKIVANGLQIEVEDSGPGAAGERRPAVLLIMGLGMQLVAWPPDMVQALVNAGYRVIRHDNRDVGLSQRMESLGKPNLIWAGLQHKLGFAPRPPYTLADMAADALGVLDALGAETAVLAGHDWGAPVAWHAALLRPDRFRAVIGLSVPYRPRGAVRPTGVMPRTEAAMFYQLYFQEPGVAEAELEQ